jgi:hypothetical protein
LTTPVAVWRNVARNTIGETIHQLRTIDDDGKPTESPLDLGTAKRDIQMAGFGLFSARELVAHLVRTGTPQGEALQRYGLRDGLLLAIPNASVKVAQHLKDTEWQHGAWKDALRQCPIDGVMIKHADLNNLRVDGVKQRCTLVALDRYHEAPER